jgi:hypothetical protein
MPALISSKPRQVTIVLLHQYSQKLEKADMIVGLRIAGRHARRLTI